jgi:hypothetical protein
MIHIPIALLAKRQEYDMNSGVPEDVARTIGQEVSISGARMERD